MDEATLKAEGWFRLPTKAFSQDIGPTFIRGERGGRTVAWLPDRRTENDHGSMIHGGALMTFADIALGSGVADAVDEGFFFVTAQLQYHFVAAAPFGMLITCDPEVVRRTSQLVFIRGLVKAGKKTIGSADGIWKVLEPEKLAKLRSG